VRYQKRKVWSGYEYRLFYRALLQKRPMILRSLLITVQYRKRNTASPCYLSVCCSDVVCCSALQSDACSSAYGAVCFAVCVAVHCGVMHVVGACSHSKNQKWSSACIAACVAMCVAVHCRVVHAIGTYSPLKIKDGVQRVLQRVLHVCCSVCCIVCCSALQSGTCSWRMQS